MSARRKFLREKAKICQRHDYLRGPGACSSEKILQKHSHIFAILEFCEIIFRVIFVLNSFAFVTATPKKSLGACVFYAYNRIRCSCTSTASETLSIKFRNLK